MLTHPWLSWRLQGRLNIYLEVSYSVCFYRDRLPQIIDSGRLVNAYRTIHILVCAHQHLLKRSPAVPGPAVFTSGSSLWHWGPCFALIVVADSVPKTLPLSSFFGGLLRPPGQWQRCPVKGCLLSLCYSCQVESCYQGIFDFPLIPQWVGFSVSLQNYKNTYTFIYKCINI